VSIFYELCLGFLNKQPNFTELELFSLGPNLNSLQIQTNPMSLTLVPIWNPSTNKERKASQFPLNRRNFLLLKTILKPLSNFYLGTFEHSKIYSKWSTKPKLKTLARANFCTNQSNNPPSLLHSTFVICIQSSRGGRPA
jgi:hypothetical protein